MAANGKPDLVDAILADMNKSLGAPARSAHTETASESSRKRKRKSDKEKDSSAQKSSKSASKSAKMTDKAPKAPAASVGKTQVQVPTQVQIPAAASAGSTTQVETPNNGAPSPANSNVSPQEDSIIFTYDAQGNPICDSPPGHQSQHNPQPTRHHFTGSNRS